MSASTLLNFCFLPPQHCSASGFQPHLCVCVRARARVCVCVPTVPACLKQPVRVLARGARAGGRVKSPAAQSKQEQTGMNQTEQPPTAGNLTSRVTTPLLIGGGRDTDRKTGSDWRRSIGPRPYLYCHVVWRVKGEVGKRRGVTGNR